MYEGNVQLSLMHGSDLVARHFCQASAGGPERGEWLTESELPRTVDAVFVHQETMEESSPELETAQTVRISLGGTST